MKERHKRLTKYKEYGITDSVVQRMESDKCKITLICSEYKLTASYENWQKKPYLVEKITATIDEYLDILLGMKLGGMVRRGDTKYGRIPSRLYDWSYGYKKEEWRRYTTDIVYE